MKWSVVLTVLVLSVDCLPVQINGPSPPPRYKGPVIGVLTQKPTGRMAKLGHSYIAASYVKYLQMAGAQVIPVFDSSNQEELNRTLSSINGMLIPGGAQMIPKSKFYEASKFIYEWTVSQNGNGTYFPLWGTCLGFEAILYAAVDANLTSEVRFNCSAHMPNNLTVQDGAEDSRILKNLDSKLYQAIITEKLVYNAHKFCLSPNLVENPKGPLHNHYDLLAVNYDSHGQEYMALVEHKKYPIYASQFHPEKNAFEWSIYADIPHSRNAILFMQYLGNFLVDEASKNNNKFEVQEEFYKRSINVYNTVYTAVVTNSTLESCYFFKDKRDDLNDDTTD